MLTVTLKRFYHRLQVLVRHFKFHANSLRAAPGDFGGNFDRFLVIGERKDQCNLLSNGEGHTGFDKHSAGIYVLNEILEDTVPRSIIYAYEAGFPGMVPLLSVLPILLQQPQKCSLLVFRYIADQFYQPSGDPGLVRLLDGTCHTKRSFER